MGALAAISVPAYQRYSSQAELRKLYAVALQFRKAFEMCISEHINEDKDWSGNCDSKELLGVECDFCDRVTVKKLPDSPGGLKNRKAMKLHFDFGGNGLQGYVSFALVQSTGPRSPNSGLHWWVEVRGLKIKTCMVPQPHIYPTKGEEIRGFPVRTCDSDSECKSDEKCMYSLERL